MYHAESAILEGLKVSIPTNSLSHYFSLWAFSKQQLSCI